MKLRHTVVYFNLVDVFAGNRHLGWSILKLGLFSSDSRVVCSSDLGVVQPGLRDEL